MRKNIVTERTNVFEPNNTITMKFTIAGAVKPEKIQQAFLTAIRENETLNSRVILAENGEVWYEPCGKTQIQKNYIESTDQSWQKIFQEQQKVLFEIEQGELIKGYIFPEEDQTEVMLMANHLAGDGKAILYFVEQIMCALANERVPYQKLQSISEEEIPERNKIPFYVNWFIRSSNRKWRKRPEVFTMEDRSRIHRIFWERNQVKLWVEHFSREELERVLDKARGLGVSLTSYLIAAYCQKIPDWKIPDWKIPDRITVGLAVDVRANRNRDMGNQTSGITIRCKCRDRIRLDQNARSISKQLKKKLASQTSKYFVLNFLSRLDGTLRDSIYMYLSGTYQNRVSQDLARACGYGEYSPDLSLSNLTVADIRVQYGDFELKDLVFIPPLVSYGRRMLGIVTLNHEMNITWQVQENENAESEQNEFREIMRRLKQ